ncbi:MAG: hypothetical protein BGO51_26585 [Rhodospirillales bacterium 69-11]|nr:hypothetical protein [Rhodospirillales bacterium]MBN8925608.1 hypothetical protein [Rhodospirillales bacterium]OJW19762.1 MAG: hypothetical protein BGO51_26585 [Rhodospirillales bacterium 69-11]
MQVETALPNAHASSGALTMFKPLGRARLVLAGLALALIGTGLAWQWSWLVAIGVGPLLISAGPCVAMCTLGLCMHRMSGTTGREASTGSSQNSSFQQET